MSNQPKLITTTQLAEKLGVTTGRIRQWIAAGRLQSAMQLPSGDHLFLPNTKRPEALRRGPKNDS
jgi:excisionase family DNA binding protein